MLVGSSFLFGFAFSLQAIVHIPNSILTMGVASSNKRGFAADLEQPKLQQKVELFGDKFHCRKQIVGLFDIKGVQYRNRTNDVSWCCRLLGALLTVYSVSYVEYYGAFFWYSVFNAFWRFLLNFTFVLNVFLMSLIIF